MDPLLFCLLVGAFVAQVTHGKERLEHARHGTTPPSHQERMRRLDQAHAERMKRWDNGHLTIPEALNRRIARAIHQPRTRKPHGPAAEFFAAWYSDAWDAATARRRNMAAAAEERRQKRRREREAREQVNDDPGSPHGDHPSGRPGPRTEPPRDEPPKGPRFSFWPGFGGSSSNGGPTGAGPHSEEKQDEPDGPQKWTAERLDDDTDTTEPEPAPPAPPKAIGNGIRSLPAGDGTTAEPSPDQNVDEQPPADTTTNGGNPTVSHPVLTAPASNQQPAHFGEIITQPQAKDFTEAFATALETNVAEAAKRAEKLTMEAQAADADAATYQKGAHALASAMESISSFRIKGAVLSTLNDASGQMNEVARKEAEINDLMAQVAALSKEVSTLLVGARENITAAHADMGRHDGLTEQHTALHGDGGDADFYRKV